MMGAGDNDLTLATLRQNKALDAVSQIFLISTKNSMPVLGANCRHKSGEMEKVVRFVSLNLGKIQSQSAIII